MAEKFLPSPVLRMDRRARNHRRRRRAHGDQHAARPAGQARSRGPCEPSPDDLELGPAGRISGSLRRDLRHPRAPVLRRVRRRLAVRQPPWRAQDRHRRPAGQAHRVRDPGRRRWRPVAQAEGEIAIRGRQTAVGSFTPDGVYQDLRPHRHDQWMRTGDLGAFDDDGFVTVTGRAKDLSIPRRDQYRAAGDRCRPVEPPQAARSRRRRRSRPDLWRGDCRLRGRKVRRDRAARRRDRPLRGGLPDLKVPKTVRVIAALRGPIAAKIRREALKDMWLARHA